MASPRASFYSNDLSGAHKQFHKLNEKPKHDESVVELDLAMVELLSGDTQSAESRLRSVRDTWEERERRSIAEEAASFVTDDHRRAYSGEDYERILVRVMLTLCSLMRDGADAESYSLQTLEKQQDLVASAQKSWDKDIDAQYCIPAIAPYLRGVLREQTHSDYHEALRFYSQTESLMPETPFLLDDIQRASAGVHSPTGHGVAYVIAMVGRGPYKEETNAVVTKQALLAADQILSAVGKYSVPPTLAPVKVPKIVSPPKPFDLLGVQVNGIPTSTTMPITDLHLLAEETYAKKMPHILARTVARRIIKKGAVYAAKDQLNTTSDIASLAMDAAGVLWEATESADTRCWGLLPREIQILRLELPSGTHQLSFEPLSAGDVAARPVTCSVPIADGRNTYVLSYWPGLQPVGEVLVSQP